MNHFRKKKTISLPEFLGVCTGFAVVCLLYAGFLGLMAFVVYKTFSWLTGWSLP